MREPDRLKQSRTSQRRGSVLERKSSRVGGTWERANVEKCKEPGECRELFAGESVGHNHRRRRFWVCLTTHVLQAAVLPDLPFFGAGMRRKRYSSCLAHQLRQDFNDGQPSVYVWRDRFDRAVITHTTMFRAWSEPGSERSGAGGRRSRVAGKNIANGLMECNRRRVRHSIPDRQLCALPFLEFCEAFRGILCGPCRPSCIDGVHGSCQGRLLGVEACHVNPSLRHGRTSYAVSIAAGVIGRSATGRSHEQSDHTKASDGAYRAGESFGIHGASPKLEIELYQSSISCQVPAAVFFF